LTPVVRAFTQLASAVGLIVIAVVLLIVLAVRHHARIGVAIALNLAVEAALNEVIKAIVQRPRPSVQHLVVERGFSFPSGHAMAATAFYGFLIYLLYRYRRHTAAVWALIVALGAIAPVIMFTRVYLGVHYASDVLAGCLFSIAYLTLLSVPVLRRTLLRPLSAGADEVAA
ncbi:MAG: phosphatase PAP2 family protein, partial [Bifidobacterium sp.]